MVRAHSEARFSHDEVKRRIRAGEGLEIAQLTTAEGEDFYGDQRAMYYPTA